MRKRRVARLIWTSPAAAAAALALIMVFPGEKKVARPEPKLPHIAVPVLQTSALKTTRPGRRATTPSSGGSGSVQLARSRRSTNQADAINRFYPLPGADLLSPLDYGTVVRVQLPRPALQEVGFPVAGDRMMERVEADILIGQDGLARAVRFVQ
jgi:hypothetical protein